MKLNFNDIVPIYIQIADAIEDDILSGRLAVGEPCYSQIVLAKELGINPATAGKGIRLLVERGVLEKVRGQAMHIREDAPDTIKKRKKTEMLTQKVQELVQEAKKLDISGAELLQWVKSEYEEERG